MIKPFGGDAPNPVYVIPDWPVQPTRGLDEQTRKGRATVFDHVNESTPPEVWGQMVE